MAHIFEGLQGYEQVIMAFGMVLFIVAVVGLILALIKGKSYAGLTVIFVLAIAMMGFARVRQIKVGDAEIDLDPAISELQNAPTSPAARTQLSQVVVRLANRKWTDPDLLTKLATAQQMLGETNAARANLSKALESKSAPPEAAALQKRIELEDSLPRLTRQVQENPADTAAKAQLQQSVAEITGTRVANPSTLASVASAQAALGDKEQAVKNVNQALAINPHLAEAIQLKNKL